LLALVVVALIKAGSVARRMFAEKYDGPPPVETPAAPQLAAVLSISGPMEERGLEARLTNIGENPVTIENVYLGMGRRMRGDGIPRNQIRLAGFAMDSPFVLDTPRTLAPGEDTSVTMPHSSTGLLHSLAEFINEDVALRVTGPNGFVAKIDDPAIRAIVAQLLEEQNPAVRLRVRQEVVHPKPKPGPPGQPG
jgi:hypothetical protein